MDFATYVDKCFAATSFEEKLDLHLNGVIRNESGDKQKIVVIPQVGVFEDALICETNTDAFISEVTDNLVFKDSVRLQVSYNSNFSNAILRSGLGFISVNGVPTDVKDLPHTLLFETHGDANLKTYLIFPRMEPSTSNRNHYISSEDQKSFIDYLFLFAVEKVCPQSILNRMPPSYSSYSSRGLNNAPLVFLVASLAKEVVDFMKIVAIDIPEAKKFGGFKIITIGYGFKQQFADSNTILDSLIDWNLVDKRKTLVDVAVNCYNNCGNVPTTSFLRKDKYKEFITNILPATYAKFYPLLMADFGGFSMKKTASNELGIKKLIAYSDIKYNFDLGKSKQFVDADGLWHPRQSLFKESNSEKNLFVSSAKLYILLS